MLEEGRVPYNAARRGRSQMNSPVVVPEPYRMKI